ncbi:integrase, partial [Streptomyces sp. A73]|nr:integrase [Streptomyces sp. A73]
PEGVVHAELVDDAHLPAPLPTAAPPRPVVDQHTNLAPGDPLPPEADQPTYTERDIRVSERTAERLKNQSKPKNTSR